jgi:hypothetical protein
MIVPACPRAGPQPAWATTLYHHSSGLLVSLKIEQLLASALYQWTRLLRGYSNRTNSHPMQNLIRKEKKRNMRALCNINGFDKLHPAMDSDL